jgi:hypothetical protein
MHGPSTERLSTERPKMNWPARYFHPIFCPLDIFISETFRHLYTTYREFTSAPGWGDGREDVLSRVIQKGPLMHGPAPSCKAKAVLKTCSWSPVAARAADDAAATRPTAG